jgi:membrane protease YdiL (CAAX protease family)
MEDRSTATAGVVLTGFALAAAALPWGTTPVGPVENVVLAVLGAVAFGAFTLRRNDLLGRVPAALVAGAASLGIVGYVAVVLAVDGTLVGDFDGALVGDLSPAPWATTLALVGGFGGVVAAYGDGWGFPQKVSQAAKAVGWSLFVALSGLVATFVWSSVLVSLASVAVPSTPGQMERYVLGSVALGLGAATVAFVYIRTTDETPAFLDFRVPTKRGVGYVVGGIAALLAILAGMSFALSYLGVSTASHSIERAAREGNAEMLLLVVVASWLFIGPGEELLYRNIIQKSLYGTFGEWGAVVVASVVFALGHFLAYWSPNLVRTLVSLVVVFTLSLLLGAVYLRTENTTVPAVIHGTFDAIVFASLYVSITGGA